MTVGVEIDDQVKDHHHQMKEIQRLEMHSNLTYEQHKILIENVDGGKFILIYQGQDLKLEKTSVMNVNCTA